MKCAMVYLQRFTKAEPQTRGFAFPLHTPEGGCIANQPAERAVPHWDALPIHRSGRLRT